MCTKNNYNIYRTTWCCGGGGGGGVRNGKWLTSFGAVIMRLLRRDHRFVMISCSLRVSDSNRNVFQWFIRRIRFVNYRYLPAIKQWKLAKNNNDDNNESLWYRPWVQTWTSVARARTRGHNKNTRHRAICDIVFWYGTPEACPACVYLPQRYERSRHFLG